METVISWFFLGGEGRKGIWFDLGFVLFWGDGRFRKLGVKSRKLKGCEDVRTEVWSSSLALLSSLAPS